MKQESIMAGVIGLLAGVVITGYAAGYAVNNEHAGMMRMMGIRTAQQDAGHGEMTMSGMAEMLESKSGDDFDKAFIEQMIGHHEGAINMAKLIPGRAKHQEIKALGEAIISAQTREINDMRQWQKEWGYAGNDTQMMHGGQ